MSTDDEKQSINDGTDGRCIKVISRSNDAGRAGSERLLCAGPVTGPPHPLTP